MLYVAMALLWLIIGAGFLIFGCRVHLNVRRMMRKGLTSRGKIVRIIEQEGGYGTLQIPVIEYKIHTGKILQTKSSIGWINPKLNQTFNVFYSPDHPEKMIADTFYSKYYLSLLTISFGLIFLLVGIFAL